MTLCLKITALFMSVITFFISVFGIKTTETYSYTENSAAEKTAKKLTAYEFGANDIAVSADGNDENDGSESAPVATVQRAKELAKEKRNNGVAGDIRVWISGGTYYFSEPMEFTAEDAENVCFIAVPGEEVSFDGSLPLTGWRADTANGHACVSTKVPDGLHFNSVFGNGKVLPQTRYPETGYFYIEDENHDGALFTEENSPWEATRGDTRFTPSSEQKIKEFRNIGDVTLRVLHLWVDDYTKLTAYDRKTNRYSFENPMSATIAQENKYFFENVYEAFDTPGEWYYDRTKARIYYIPTADETVSQLDIRIALTDKLIKITDCSGISFEGIRFVNTNASFAAPEDKTQWLAVYGIRFPQAEYDSEGCFEVTDAQNISIRYCDFANIGICGIKLKRRVKNALITGCNFTQIGASAVFINGENTENEADMTENITVTDNLIDGYGQYFYSAIGVFLTHARNCDISNNEICNGYYTAVSVGWLWGYDYSVTNHITITNNYLHDIGKGWLSDMGGIYTLGRQEGSVISGNVIHTVAADEGAGGYGGWGIYLDEGSQGILVEKNLVYDCGSQGFHQHYGENNIIRNNIFALNKNGQMCSSFAHGKNQIGYLAYETEEEHNEFVFEHNILLSDGTPCYVKVSNHSYKDDSNICWDMKTGKTILNLYWESTKVWERIYTKGMEHFGLYNNVQLFDPGFRDAKAFDFTLPDNNEQLNASGFEKWNYNIAGTLTER